MPTLDWIGKKAVLNHHREVPFHLLQADPKLSVGDPNSGNLLVQGDNLLALKALLPYYAGQVKCIYIDPPYNTGNENWIYNDAVNSPEIREWLGEVVGAEAEDLSRHDKWLCMMCPRLSLLREFLANDGAIFISIKNEELGHLLMMCNELFGPRNLIAVLVYHAKRGGGNDREFVVMEHEYVVSYARNRDSCEFARRFVAQDKLDLTDAKGEYRRGRELNKWGAESARADRPSMYFPITGPDGQDVFPIRNDGSEGRWRKGKAAMLQLAHEGDIDFVPRDDGTYICYEKIRKSNPRYTQYRTILSDIGTNADATKELKAIFGKKVFDTPKPLSLVRHVVDLVCDEDSLVLDSFAGTGTTGHAVLDANSEDGGTRQFILIEMDDDVCKGIAHERIKAAIDGYTCKSGKGKGSPVQGLGSGLTYAKLAAPLFSEDGSIAHEVKFADLAAHVHFIETGSPIPERASGKTPLLGIQDGVAIYLLYNGVLGDKRVNGGNVLTTPVLNSLPAHDGPKVIYGEGCRLGAQRLRREGIVFKQIPYEIKVD